MYAANCGDYESAAALIKAGADVNAEDKRKFTPLVFAVGTDHPSAKIVQLLLESGARRDLGLEWARKYRNPGVMAALGQTLRAADATQSTTRFALFHAGGAGSSIQDSIARALSSSMPSSISYTNKGGCIACHAQLFSAMAICTGKPFCGEKRWGIQEAKAVVSPGDYGNFNSGFELGIDTAVFFPEHHMLANTAAELPINIVTDARVHYLLACQSVEGDWQTGEVARSPLSEGNIPSTARALKAICYHSPAGIQTEIDEHVSRGANWLTKAEPLTTDDRAFQILGLRWAGREAPANRVKELIKKQRSNGGWGQTDQLDTDACNSAGFAGAARSGDAGVEPGVQTRR